jgi:hypothetical protein
MGQASRQVGAIHPAWAEAQRSQCGDGLTVNRNDDVFATSNPLQQSPRVISQLTRTNFRHTQL